MEWYVMVIVLMLLGGVVYLGSYSLWITDKCNGIEEECNAWKMSSELFERDMRWANDCLVKRDGEMRQMRDDWNDLIEKHKQMGNVCKSLQSSKDKAESRVNQLLSDIKLRTETIEQLEKLYWNRGCMFSEKQHLMMEYATVKELKQKGFVYDYKEEIWRDGSGNLIEPYYNDDGLIMIRTVGLAVASQITQDAS